MLHSLAMELFLKVKIALLSSIVLVEVQQDQLKVNTAMMTVLLECSGGIIVEVLELWLQPCCTEWCMPYFVGIEN